MSCDCEGHCEVDATEYEAAIATGEALLADPNISMPKNLSDMIVFFAMTVGEETLTVFLGKISETLGLLNDAPLNAQEREALGVLSASVLDGTTRAIAHYASK